jgi:hypothetical protein
LIDIGPEAVVAGQQQQTTITVLLRREANGTLPPGGSTQIIGPNATKHRNLPLQNLSLFHGLVKTF